MLHNHKIICFAIVIIAIAGCTSSIETTKKTTEVIIQEPIELKVPEITVQQELKPVDVDVDLPYTIWEGTKTVEKITEEGTKIKAKVTTKVKIDKSTGKPSVSAETKIETEPIKTQAKVRSQKIETDTRKETIGIGEYIKWIIIGFLILGGLTVFSYFKGWLSFFFPKKN